MNGPHGSEHHREQFQQAWADWHGRDGVTNSDKPRDEVAYSILEHAAASSDLAGGDDLVDRLAALPPEGREKLLSAACRQVDPSGAEGRLKQFVQHEALTQAELDAFDEVLRDTDKLVSVLDLSARLAEMSDESDLSALVGEKLFGLDQLIDALYSRLDVISVRWHVLKRPDGTVPGWLTRAKALDEQLSRGERTTSPREGSASRE